MLLRHGDVRLSPEHRLSGLSDLPLSADGTRQARAAACRRAAGARIDAVVSSPLRRAAATAAIAATELGLTADTDDDLRETDFGDWEGFTLAEIEQRWPAAAARWQHNPEQAPPGGESFADTARRVHRACDRLLLDHLGQRVLVVSHVTPIKIMLCRALDVPLATLYRMYLGQPASTRSSGMITSSRRSPVSTTPATCPDPAYPNHRRPSEERSARSSASAPGSERARTAHEACAGRHPESCWYSGSPPRSKPMAARITPSSR